MALLVAPAASAAVAKAPRPTVVALHVTRTTVSHSGGEVTITGTARHASRCTISSSPGVHGLPARISCSAGHVTKSVRLPANSGAATISYRVKVVATGAGGTSAPRYATVKVLPAAPAATLVTLPADLTKTGGTTTITAVVRRAATCELSVTPALAGLPEPVACKAGTAAVTVSTPVSMPALAGSVAAAYKFTLKVTGPGGTTSPTATATVWPPMTFSAAAPADPPEGYPGSLSCASATDCAAIDMFGNVASWNGTAWSAVTPVLPLQAGLVTGMTTAVCCPNTGFCAAVSQTGETAVEINGTWSQGHDSGVSAAEISCASASLCVAVGGDFAVAYSGGTWSAPTLLSSGSSSLQSVSCAPGTGFCIATDYDGNAYTYDGSSWSTATHFDASTDPAPVVSCASKDFCVAVDGSAIFSAGAAYTYNGTSWSAAVPVSSGTGLGAISCSGSSFCLATAVNGHLYTLKNGAWSGPETDVAGYVVSCPAEGTCGVLGTDGQVNILAGGSWTYSVTGLRPGGFTTSVSCPTASFCAAADRTGSVTFYNGSRWTVQTPTITPPGVALVSVSCTSKTFCMAADDGGGRYGSGAYTWNGKYWSGSLPGLYLTSVSCTSATFCVALGNLNTGVFVSTWNGTSWSSQAEIDSSAAAGQVSCASADFCAAVDANGEAMTFNGKSWSAPDPIDRAFVLPLTSAGMWSPSTTAAGPRRRMSSRRATATTTGLPVSPAPLRRSALSLTTPGTRCAAQAE